MLLAKLWGQPMKSMLFGTDGFIGRHIGGLAMAFLKVVFPKAAFRCWIALLAIGLSPMAAPAHAAHAPLRLGIDVLLESDHARLSGKHIGLVTNAGAVDAQYRSTLERLSETPGIRLVALFGPEHGVRGDAAPGAHVANAVDGATGLPVYSLYGATREPTAEMLRGIDLLIIDLPDAGARPFTYAATIMGVLRAAQRHGIAVMLLDRPNPIGGLLVEGPMLDPAYLSFVGPFAMPMRHGMTMGELARLFNVGMGINADLTVVRMRGWRRDGRGAGAPWVMPSPNMPTMETALVYPGMVLVEGTNLSEGRGTTRPFEMVGAPFIDPVPLAAQMNALHLPGIRFRATWFTPTTSKFAGERCGGLALHVTDRARFRPVRTAIILLQQIARAYPTQFRILGDAPTEAGNGGNNRAGHQAFFELLAGNGWLRGAVMAGESPAAMEERDAAAMALFLRQRRQALLYSR